MILGQVVIRPIFRIISIVQRSELFTAVVLLVILGTSWITYEAGLSMAMGAFLAGLLLSEIEYHIHMVTNIQPFRGCFAGLVFCVG